MKAKTNSVIHGPSGIVVRVSDDYKTATVEGPVDLVNGLIDAMARSLSVASIEERRRANVALADTANADALSARSSEWWKFALRVGQRRARRWKGRK